MSQAATKSTALSPAFRLYLQVVVGMGSLGLVHAVLGAARTPQPLAWLSLGALALLSGWLRLSVKSISATAGMHDPSCLPPALLFGPSVATLAAAAHSIVFPLRRRRPIPQVAFNA